MSYAAVAAHNAPPPSQQPHADPALLTTPGDIGPSTNVADDMNKVGTVSHDFKEHPATITSETPVLTEASIEAKGKAKGKVQQWEDEAHKDWHKAEDEGFYLWNVLREQLLRPGVAGGLIGVVNVGLLGTASYHLYTQQHLRRDPKVLGATIGGALAILGAEGFGAAQYRQTPAGKEEERRARKEGAVVYKHAREAILRPGVLGGLVGLVNVGILGTVGYFAYENWDRPSWDRRTVSAVSVGLLTLWAGEGFVAEQVREGKIQPPRA